MKQLEEVARTHSAMYQRMAYKYLRSREDAEDCVQDALLKAFEHLGQFKGKSQLSTWVGTIVIRCALVRLRRRQPIMVAIDDPDTRFLLTYEDHVVERKPIFFKPPQELLRHLQPCQQAVLTAVILEGMTNSEAAEKLGVSVGTVKAHASRGRKRLRETMVV